METDDLDRLDAQENHVARAGWLTVERGAYIVIGLWAAAMRFVGLGLRPLSEAEAQQALAVFRFISGEQRLAPAGTLPALFTGNVLSMTLVGPGDAAARWLPALAGLVLALLPYALRDRIGRGAALVASLLLALSPTALFASRTADGATLVAACALALATGLLNYTDTQRPGWLYLAAAALGLGLAAGPGIYSLLLILVVYGLLLFFIGKTSPMGGDWASLKTAYDAARARPEALEQEGGRGLSVLVTAGVVAAGVFALSATTLALHPAGIGHAADLLGTWVQDLLPGGDQPALYTLLLLLRYEALILFLAVIEIVRWARARGGLPWVGNLFVSHTRFLTFWAAGALLLSLIGTRSPGSLLLALVPLALLSGMAVEHVAGSIGQRLRWPDVLIAAGVALTIGVFLYLQMAAYSRASSAATTSVANITLSAANTHLILAAVALLLLIALAVLARLWRSGALTAAAGWLALSIVLLLFGLKGAWSANFDHAANPRELMVARTTDPQVRVLAQDLETLSLNWTGARYTLPVTVDPDLGPVVAWYLRRFSPPEPLGEASKPSIADAFVTLGADNPPGEQYTGRSYALETHWSPWGLWGQNLVRWLLFTGAGEPVVDREAVLWVAR